MTIVLDSGAFIAVERNDTVMKAFLAAARDESTTVVVPATVVAETWRGARNAKASLLVKSTNECVSLTLTTARETGELLAKSKRSTVIDANVVVVAIARRPSTIVTSDPDDIARLLEDANISYAREDSPQNVDVTIVSV